jgi:hypothetical protein
MTNILTVPISGTLVLFNRNLPESSRLLVTSANLRILVLLTSISAGEILVADHIYSYEFPLFFSLFPSFSLFFSLKKTTIDIAHGLWNIYIQEVEFRHPLILQIELPNRKA